MLAKRRKRAGLSQRQLGELANMSQKYVGEVERGQANLTLDLMHALGLALRWNILEAVAEPDPEPVEPIDVRALQAWLLSGMLHLGTIAHAVQRIQQETGRHGRSGQTVSSAPAPPAAEPAAAPRTVLSASGLAGRPGHR